MEIGQVFICGSRGRSSESFGPHTRRVWQLLWINAEPTGTERLQDLWTQANAHFQADAQRGDSYRRITILVS